MQALYQYSIDPQAKPPGHIKEGTQSPHHTRTFYTEQNRSRRDPMPRENANATSQDELLNEFQALVSDTEKLLQHSASLVGEQAEELREQIRTSLGRARSTLHNAEDSLRDRGKAAVQATEGYVQTHPWQTLGVAAAIGLLLGMLISRR
jgi:ElaB/YqjD/DUF883 family membrane-anchored ribosome-binding protein